MNKQTVLGCAIGNLKLSEAEYKTLKQQLVEYEKEHKFNDGKDFANGITSDLPYLRMLHEYSMRSFAKQTASNTNVVKIILIIYLIASVIVGLSMIK